MLESPRAQVQGQFTADARTRRRGIDFFKLAIVVGVAYFLAARLSLLLLTKPGVAVFWPAAGISSGILIALGRQARWPVAAGTIAATIVANLLGDRNIWSSSYFALCDAGEALFVSWMIQRYFGSHFDLGAPSRVLGFLASAIVGTAASGVAGTVGYKLFHSPDEPVWVTWQHWFASDLIGIITVAPLIVGLVSTRRTPLLRRELAEGAAALLAIVVAVGIIILKLPPTWWDIDVIVVLLLPLLVWAAARCPPVFSAAAVFSVCLMVVLALTFGLGHFGAAFPSTDEMILNAYVGIVGVTLCSLILASLFAERRYHEAALEARETGLQDALAAGAVMAFEWDMSTDLARRSTNAAQILRLDPRHIPTGTSYLARVHPEDRSRYRALVEGLNRNNSAYSITYRFTRSDGRELRLEETSNAEFDAVGRLARIKGLTRDITERTQAEEQQKILVAELRDSEDRMRAIVDTVVDGIITIDDKGIVENLNPAAGRIFGYSPEEVVGRNIKMLMPEPYRREHDGYLTNYLTTGQAKIIGLGREVSGQRKDGSIFPIELAVSELRVTGRRMFTGVVRDITERRRADERQKLLVAELDHRVKNVLVRVAAIVTETREGSSSMDDFVKRLGGRLQSMSAAHTLLSKGRWHGVGIADLIRDQLAPYATGANVTIEGPNIVLAAATTQALAMVVHELATNAVKFGALSTPVGRVSIGWGAPSGVDVNADLTVEWRETGGPPLTKPSQAGFGTSLIDELISHELGGAVDLVFAPDGVRCRMKLPLGRA
jgi:PAS domain S-box-containing protein